MYSPVTEPFTDADPASTPTDGNSGQCINQMNAVVAQMRDSDQMCNRLPGGETQSFEASQESIRQQTQEFTDRFNKLKADFDLTTAFVDASNKAAVLADNTNQSNQAINNNKLLKLSQFNGDAMTAKRVATLSQQDLIQTNVVIGYMQICCIFFAVAILVMFPFAFSVVRGFFRHPMIVMQILLILLVVIVVVVVLLHLWANRNHYWMLYQERVFSSPKIYTTKDDDCDCGPDSSDDPPVATMAPEETCS